MPVARIRFCYWRDSCRANALSTRRGLARRRFSQQLQLGSRGVDGFEHIAIMGGMIYIVAFGAGAYSLDNLMGRRK
jgi:hypothetical protein